MTTAEKRDAHTRLLFYQSKPIGFFAVLVVDVAVVVASAPYASVIESTIFLILFLTLKRTCP